MNKINNCPICESDKKQLVISLNSDNEDRYFQFSKIKYGGFIDSWAKSIEVAIDCCQYCGHHWYRAHPKQDDLLKMYAAGRPLRPRNSIIDNNPKQKIIDELKKIKKIGNGGGHLLDYGSGFGNWARAGVNAGYIVTAYDPSKERSSESKKIEYTLIHEKKYLLKQEYDYINLEQVLEHIPNPVETLKEIRDYCTPGAILRITVPNILHSSEEDKLWKEWPFNNQSNHIMAPFEHLHGFTPMSLLLLIKRAGFKPVSLGLIFIYFPVLLLRKLLGSFIPKIGTTTLFVEPCS